MSDGYEDYGYDDETEGAGYDADAIAQQAAEQVAAAYAPSTDNADTSYAV